MKFDLLIIGSGIVGSSALYMALQKKRHLKIALIEKNLIGGDISRYGGAAHLVFGTPSSIELSKTSSKYFKSFYEENAPISKIECRIFTKDAGERFPLSQALNNESYFIQEAYIANPSQLSSWIIESNLDKFTFFEGIDVLNIDTSTNKITTSIGQQIYFDNLIACTGNYKLSINNNSINGIIKYKKLCVLYIDFLDKSFGSMSYFDSLDSYIFYSENDKKYIFCYPTNYFTSDYKEVLKEYSLTEQDLELGNYYLNLIFKHSKYRIFGGRVKFEGYTENRMPNFYKGLEKNNIFFLNAFSGSGLRHSLGTAENLINSIFKEL